MTRSFFNTPNPSNTEKNHDCVPMQGNGKWHLVWEPLVEFARTHNLAKISIDLNLAWLHEGYHASWSAIRMPERANQVQLKWPLVVRVGADQTLVNIGNLNVVAEADSPDVHERIADLSVKLADLSSQINVVIKELERQHAKSSRENASEQAASKAKRSLQSRRSELRDTPVVSASSD